MIFNGLIANSTSSECDQGIPSQLASVINSAKNIVLQFLVTDNTQVVIEQSLISANSIGV